MTRVQRRMVMRAHGRKVVTEAEFQEFLELADYMNFDFNPI